MSKDKERVRKRAMARYEKGEPVSTIWQSLGQSRPWFYKWLRRYQNGQVDWYVEQSRHPRNNPHWTTAVLEEQVKFVRLELYNQAVFCGAQAIRWRLEELAVEPLPSLSTIGRILVRHDLTDRRTGRYEPKGVYYPRVEVQQPNDLHQSDFVGPCFLKGGLRFYSLGLRDLVWVILEANMVESLMDTGFPAYATLFKFGIMFGWKTQRSDSGGCGMGMRCLVFVRCTRCAVFSVIRKRVSSLWYGAQKNCLRGLWLQTLGLVRPQHAPGSGSV
jgi:hypothetical protein